jgi:5-methylcytosine-specific restriction enzyme A
VKLFLHHVGQEGAEEDFNKTVYKDISIGTVESNVPVSDPRRDELLNELRQEFPRGFFNCWGVPSGASSVIRRLEAGDYVLLLESATQDGQVPVLCQVRLYWPHKLWDLSLSLWNSYNYPYIFFFHTEMLNLGWPEFMEHVGYKPTYNPRGNFNSVASEKLSDFGGVEEYIRYLRGHYSTAQDPFAPVTEQDLAESGVGQTVDKGKVDQALTVGEKKLKHAPQLTEGLDPQQKQIKESIRISVCYLRE